MTKDDSYSHLELYLTNAMIARYPLDRQTVRDNVRSALKTLASGLEIATVCGMTGELTEVTLVYTVRTP